MTRKRLALVCLGLAVLGGVVGALARGGSAPGRPSEVGEALDALDKDDRAALARAVLRAGPTDSYAAPWRDEIRVARLAAAGDHDGLWTFATASGRGAAQARALVFLVQRGRDRAERERARARMIADYPDSWATALLAKGPEGDK